MSTYEDDEDTVVMCPRCDCTEILFVETETKTFEMLQNENETLVFDDNGEIEETQTHTRLRCDACDTEFPIPTSIKLRFE